MSFKKDTTICKDCLHPVIQHITSTLTGMKLPKPRIDVRCLVCNNHCRCENEIAAKGLLT